MTILFRALRWFRHLLPADFAGRRIMRRAYEQLVRSTRRLGADSGVPVNIGGCGTFALDPLVASGRYEEFGTGHNSGLNQWVALCTGKHTVIDIGAHIGLYSLPASRVVAPGGWIYAFEPAVANAAVLEKHLKYNDVRNIRVLPWLVGEHEEAAIGFFERDGEVDGMNAIVVQKNQHLYSRTVRRQVSLDSFCVERQIRPQVVKIDVEGAELRVLRGARRVLTEDRPVVFLSVHPGRVEAFDDSLEEMDPLLADLGYVAFDHAGQPVRRFEFDEYVLMPAAAGEAGL